MDSGHNPARILRPTGDTGMTKQESVSCGDMGKSVKKGWWARFLEKLARANETAGVSTCPT